MSDRSNITAHADLTSLCAYTEHTRTRCLRTTENMFKSEGTEQYISVVIWAPGAQVP